MARPLQPRIERHYPSQNRGGKRFVMKSGNAVTVGEKSNALEDLTHLAGRGENPYMREWKDRGGSERTRR